MSERCAPFKSAWKLRSIQPRSNWLMKHSPEMRSRFSFFYWARNCETSNYNEWCLELNERKWLLMNVGWFFGIFWAKNAFSQFSVRLTTIDRVALFESQDTHQIYYAVMVCVMVVEMGDNLMRSDLNACMWWCQLFCVGIFARAMYYYW